MPDLAERIREYVDAAQPPVTMADVRRRLDQSNRNRMRTSYLNPPRLRLTVAGVIAVAIVSVVAVVSIGVNGGNETGQPAARQALSMAPASVVLRKVATLANTQSPLVPGPGQYLYVRTLGASVVSQGAKSPTTGREETWTYYEQTLTQRWTSAREQGATTSGEVNAPQFLTNADMAGWRAAGSPPISAGGGGNPPSPYYDVADLPTDPNKIAAYLASQKDLPASNLSSTAVWQFDEAAQFLGAGASSAQRAALFSFMATLPGVANYGSVTTLGTDTTGIAIGIQGRNGERIEAIIDPSTSNILELRAVVNDPSQYPASLAGDWRVVAGEVQYYDDYVSVGVVDSDSASPEDAPTLPAAWPFGVARQPQSSVAYPNL